jgi:hypothetical protein
MIHINFFFSIEITVIALIFSTTQTIALVQATNDFAGEANIHTVSSIGKFTSETSSVRYNVDPSTKKGYYFIGSNYQEFENTPTDKSTIDKGTEIIRSTSDMTNDTHISKIEQPQPSMNINKTISDAYIELFTVINDFCEIEQPQPSMNINKTISDAYIELFTVINNKAQHPLIISRDDPGGNTIYGKSKYNSQSPPVNIEYQGSSLDSSKLLSRLSKAMSPRK